MSYLRRRKRFFFVFHFTKVLMLYKEEKKKKGQYFLHDITRNDNETYEAARVIVDMAVRWGLNFNLYMDQVINFITG